MTDPVELIVRLAIGYDISLLFPVKKLIRRSHGIMNSLKSYFQNGGFSANEAQEIADRFTLKNLKKGTYFVEEGKTSKLLGFIETGFFQYYINIDGEEKTTYFLGSNNLIVSLVSFLKQVPARENIRAVVNSAIWVLRRMN